MNLRMHVSLAMLLASSIAAGQGQSTPPAMSVADLIIGGMKWIPDTADARRALGASSTVKPYVTRIDDADLHLTDWIYPGLRLIFSQNGRLRWARVTSRKWPTHRGLRVGDPISKTLSLYGQPLNQSANEYVYNLPGDERPSRLGLFVMFEKGRVTVIGIGLIVEGD